MQEANEKGPFRSVDSVSSTDPRLRQARRVTSSARKGGLFRRLKSIALAGGIITGGAAAVAVIADEVGKPRAETYATYQDQIEAIDTGKYLISPHLDGQPDLNIRHDPYRKGDEEKDNKVDLGSVISINGTAWDGKTPMVMENIPITINEDPSNGILRAPWFAVRLGVRSLLGNITKTVGFISHSSATQNYIVRLEEGEIANASFDTNGRILGRTNSGQQIPNSEIGITKVAGASVTTVVGNPQK